MPVDSGRVGDHPAVERSAVIDIGSNSFRLVVYGWTRAPLVEP